MTYDPELYRLHPHHRYSCDCGESCIVIGWEIAAVRCNECEDFMEWDETLHHPRYER